MEVDSNKNIADNQHCISLVTEVDSNKNIADNQHCIPLVTEVDSNKHTADNQHCRFLVFVTEVVCSKNTADPLQKLTPTRTSKQYLKSVMWGDTSKYIAASLTLEVVYCNTF